MSLDPNVVADLRATVDYLHDIVENSDSADFDEAAAAVDELVRVKAKAGEAVDMLRQQMLSRLEAERQPRMYGTRVFARVPNQVERHDHERIRQHVREVAVAAHTDRDTGEVDTRAALNAGLAMMADIYLSRSSTAKVTPLRDTELPKSEYVTREVKGWKLNVVDTSPE